MDKVRNEMIKEVGIGLGVEGGVLKGVELVEGGGRDGFLGDGRGEIVFEGEIMQKEVDKKLGERDLGQVCKRYCRILLGKWDKWKQLGGVEEQKRVELGKEIEEECGLKCGSWGMLEICGLNEKVCECKDVLELVDKMWECDGNEVEVMYYLMKKCGCLSNVKEKEWGGFGRKQNGGGYGENGQEEKVRNGQEKLKDKL